VKIRLGHRSGTPPRNMSTAFTSGSMSPEVNTVNMRVSSPLMARTTYHHGDLSRALVAEAVQLARAGGPDAVVLREVARRLQVSPAALYRHFPDRDALLGEVASIARQDLAGRMRGELDRVHETDRLTRSIRRFQAIGRGYLKFAQEEPNLLAAAFLPIAPSGGEVAEDPSPWHVLGAALDELAETGAMPPERRAGAETIAWSAVHGFAILRAGRAFVTSGEPQPDPDALLDAIARSLDIAQSHGGRHPVA
jgi:AcrR family transcriptional regulator